MATREEALRDIVAESQEEQNPGKEQGLAAAAAQAVEVIGRRRYFELRDTWSSWIIKWITTLIAFNSFVTVAVGFKWLDYSDYEWFITAVLVQTFLQIVGLGAVAVAYLFKDK